MADLIRENDQEAFAYGDIGVLLGRAIRRSALCQGDYVLGEETIRATVIGAGCHSTQLSGSTVFARDVAFPLQNLPVLALTDQEQAFRPGPWQSESGSSGPVGRRIPRSPLFARSAKSGL